MLFNNRYSSCFINRFRFINFKYVSFLHFDFDFYISYFFSDCSVWCVHATAKTDEQKRNHCTKSISGRILISFVSSESACSYSMSWMSVRTDAPCIFILYFALWIIFYNVFVSSVYVSVYEYVHISMIYLIALEFYIYMYISIYVKFVTRCRAVLCPSMCTWVHFPGIRSSVVIQKHSTT